MSDAVAASAALPAPGTSPVSGDMSQAAPHGTSFHDILSALNPLQYLPVIGTIYRAVTGDELDEPVRRVGSFVASGLLGGPVGLAANLVTLAAEKLSGIDLDRTGQLLLGRTTDPAPAQAASTDALADAGDTGAGGNSATGQRRDMAQRDEPLSWQDLHGSEALNSQELRRIQAAGAAYASSAYGSAAYARTVAQIG
jgi:hypothetical protein